MFGKWKTIAATILGAISVCMGILVLCGCSLVPCVRGLVSKALVKCSISTMMRDGPTPDSDQGNVKNDPPGLVDDEDFDPERPPLDEMFISSDVGDLAVAVKELEGVLGIPLSGFVTGPGSGATKLPMDQLTQYLRKALHLSDKDPVPVQLSPSQSNSLYHLTTGGRHLLLRKQQKGSQAMETEYRLLKALNGSGIPVPEIIGLCEDPSVLGAPFLLMEVCLGRMFSDPSLPGLTPGDRRALYQAMKHTLCQIHCLDTRAVGLEDYGEPDYMGLQVEWWTQQYRDSETPHHPRHGDTNTVASSAPPQTPEIYTDPWKLQTGEPCVPPREAGGGGSAGLGPLNPGDPISDLTFSCMARCLPQDNPLLTGISDKGLVQLGIPSVEEVIGQYSSSMGLEEGVLDWQFYMAFHLFSLAASHQGESKNTIAGQTGSGRLAEQVADLAWDFATKEGFRIFNAKPSAPHAGTSPLKGQVAG